MGQFKSLFEHVRHVKEGRKLIDKFKYNHCQIQFIEWSRKGFNNYAVIVHDPDIAIQNQISQIMEVFPMKLSQVEIAFDFFPDDKYDLYDLRR